MQRDRDKVELNSKFYKVYHAYLWTEPPNSTNRKNYDDRLDIRLRSWPISGIATARGCEPEEGEELRTHHILGGIPTIISARWTRLDEETQQSVEDIQLVAQVREITIGIKRPICAEEESVLKSKKHVQKLIDDIKKQGMTAVQQSDGS